MIWTLQNISLSVNDLLACCGFLCGDGCDGGYPISAWRYFVNHGVVTEEVSSCLASLKWLAWNQQRDDVLFHSFNIACIPPRGFD